MLADDCNVMSNPSPAPTRRDPFAIGAIVVLSALAACGSSDEADASGEAAVTVTDARYREAKPGLGAAYLTLTNDSDEAVTLDGVTSPAAGSVEIHETVASDDGSMSMRELSDGITIEPGQSVSLEPGGAHLMLMELADTDDAIELNLRFGSVAERVTAEPIE